MIPQIIVPYRFNRFNRLNRGHVAGTSDMTAPAMAGRF